MYVNSFNIAFENPYPVLMDGTAFTRPTIDVFVFILRVQFIQIILFTCVKQEAFIFCYFDCDQIAEVL